MRKSAITCFAVLYGILVLTVSLERFNEWIAQEAVGLGNFASGQHSLCLTKAGKSETRLQYRKIVERHFVVEAPREAAGIPIDSTRHTSLPYFQSHAGWADPPVFPRAPPLQI
jgi:hypothetical protein